MVSAWYGGLGPGLFATVLSALSIDYFFRFPVHEISFDFNARLRLAVFLLIALLTSSFAAARRRK